MKNAAKELFCVLLVAVMALSFASCGGNPQPASQITGPKAGDAVKGFMDAALKLDGAEMAKYVNEAVLPEELEQVDMQTLLAEIGEETGMPMDDFAETIYKVIRAAISYEIKAVAQKGDTAEVTVSYSIKDTTTLENMDFESLFSDSDLQTQLLELIENGAEIYDSEEELMAAVMDMVLPVMEETMLEALENAPVNTEEMKIPLVLVNGEWKINDESILSDSILSEVQNMFAL